MRFRVLRVRAFAGARALARALELSGQQRFGSRPSTRSGLSRPARDGWIEIYNFSLIGSAAFAESFFYPALGPFFTAAICGHVDLQIKQLKNPVLAGGICAKKA